MPLVLPRLIASEQCVRAFGRIAWAFLFFIDLRIGTGNVHVDILPDFVGWALVASALGTILDLHTDVRPVRTLTFWLVFLSIFDLVEVRIPLGRVGPYHTWITPTFPLLLIATVLDVIVIWRLCGIIMDMAEAAESRVIWERADFRRKLYLAFAVAITVVVGLCMAVPQLVLAAFVVGLPVAIILFCLMIGLMKGTQRMCRDYRVAGTSPRDWETTREGPIDWTPPPEEPL